MKMAPLHSFRVFSASVEFSLMWPIKKQHVMARSKEDFVEVKTAVMPSIC